MTLQVLRPGPLTTVQDLGRTGHRGLGVGSAGALDAFSARVANLLVGNPMPAALLECTLAGPTLRFARAARVALTGAPLEAELDGTPVPDWRPIDVPAGATLHLGACRRGVRSYLAVEGGIVVAPVLGSRSTDLRGGFGGLEGRALRAGDRLPLGAAKRDVARPAIARWWIDATPDLMFEPEPVLRVLAGRDATRPEDAAWAAAWRVSSRSDRQGVRLEGPSLPLADARERVSEPVAPGTIQLPPDGQPIVLLGDAQTVGGYPRIGHVATVDLPRLAQCRPGSELRFTPIGLAEAMALLAAQRARLARIGLAIEARGRA
jgi:biotin-dependent carboxylase-like uncharacterized protein